MDFVRTAVADFSAEYRSGGFPPLSRSLSRPQITTRPGNLEGDPELFVSVHGAGQWFNYTRQIPPSRYRVWIAAASARCVAGRDSGDACSG